MFLLSVCVQTLEYTFFAASNSRFYINFPLEPISFVEIFDVLGKGVIDDNTSNDNDDDDDDDSTDAIRAIMFSCVGCTHNFSFPPPFFEE